MSERPDAPAPRFAAKAISELESLKSHYPNLKACILPALWIAQREYDGFLSADAIDEVAERLGRSAAEVQGVATFYSMYNTQHRPGRHMIEVCTCLTCAVCGAFRIGEYLEKKLGIKMGETTPDGMFTIHGVECLNACDRAPLIQVGDEYHGPMDEAKIDALIDRLRNETESKVVALADAVVQVHLKEDERKKAQEAVRP